MKNAKQVHDLIKKLKNQGVLLSDAVWQTAMACVGFPYVFGAWGEECNPQKRGRRVSADHPKTKEKCQVLSGKWGSCTGCEWYPNNERVLMFDCRGLTGWCLEQFGIKISKTGATSQWNGDYWLAKGTIDTCPDDVLVCLFYPEEDNPSKMAHTGFGYHGETVEASVGVEYHKTRNKKWKYWAIPKGIGANIPDYRPTLKRGDKGEYVTLLQTKLFNRGYDLGKCGIDGDYGRATEAAVKAFQHDNGLKEDGICGQRTWEALESVEPTKLYTATIPHLPMYQAEALIRQYGGGSYMTLED